MTFKQDAVASSSKRSFRLHLLLAFILLTLGEISSPHAFQNPTNNTRSATRDIRIFQLVNNVTAKDGDEQLRAPKLLSKINATRKAALTDRPYMSYWNVSGNGNYSTIRNISPSLNRTAGKNSSFIDAFLNKRLGTYEKYPNGHYTVYRTETGHLEDQRKSYAVTEDYNEHHQNHNNMAADYYPPHIHQEYEENYNTIPEDMSTGYDVPITPGYEAWKVTYVPANDPGYFGPPISGGEPVREPPNIIPDTRECICPPMTRSYECDDPSGNFLHLVVSLGKNLWALINLIAVSSLPFLIPLLALKMILVPLKILKLLKLTKLFLKFFIILPFFIRVVYPALTSSFHAPSFIFQKMQDVFPDDDSHHPRPAHSHDAESSESPESPESRHDQDEKNDSTLLERDDRLLLNQALAPWDLRQCPSRVTCEIGAFLASLSGASFPRNLANYLAGRADRASRGIKARSSKDEEDEEQHDNNERDEAYEAFLIALGNKWNQEQCRVYSCLVLL